MARLPDVQCDNMNHRQPNARVSHCPQCGGVVNANLPHTQCDAQKHAASIRTLRTFCVDCGTKLINAR